MKEKRIIIPAIISLVIIFGLFLDSAEGADAFISDLNLVIKSNVIIAKAQLTGAFTKKISKAIESGLETKFNFFIRVKRVKKGWADKTIYKEKFFHSVEYDNLERQFKVSVYRGDKMEELFTDDVETMKQWMSTIFRKIIIKPEAITKDKTFYFEIKAEMYSYRLFFPFNYLFFFITWDFDTPWTKFGPPLFK